MANATSEPDTTIEALLQERAQYEQWLARLDSAGEKASPAVRAKVRGDYEARLRGVIDQLRGHAAAIAGELERHRNTQAGLDHERRHVEEALAEAEVRHVVGEHTQDEWRRISEESNERLGRLRADLRGVGDEIGRLAEVQGLIGAAPKPPESRPTPPAPQVTAAAPPPEAAAEPDPGPAPEPMVEEAPPSPAPPAASRPAPKAAPTTPSREPEITHGTTHGDELAFLKSVAPDEERTPPPAPAPRRASNPGPSGSAGGRKSDAPATTTQTVPSKPGAAGVAKTLKCGECGTLNRPTEWYCERCGAELAGI